MLNKATAHPQNHANARAPPGTQATVPCALKNTTLGLYGTARQLLRPSLARLLLQGPWLALPVITPVCHTA